MDDLRILLVKLSAIGDVVHCLPFAGRIKEFLPDSELTWLIEPAAKDLVAGNPAVDRVIVFPRKSWLGQLKNPLKALSTPPSVLSFFKELKDSNFDIAVDAQGLLKSAVPVYLSGAPRRVGFAGTREGAYRLLTDALVVGDYFGSERHVVDLNLALADHVIKIAGGISGAASESSSASGQARHAAQGPTSGVSFPLPKPGDASQAKVSALLEAAFEKGGTPSPMPGKAPPIVALIPSTTWATKIWSVNSWVELGVKLVKRFGVRLVLVGGPADKAMNQSIYKGLVAEDCHSVVDLSGETGLMDLVALYERCDLIVGADTGPLHLAAATAHNNGSPNVVAVHGSTPWLRNGPYGYMGSTVHLNLECQPCFEKKCPLGTLACLKDLPVEEVFAAVSQFLE